ncbi:MAG: glycoside hydrolase family 15 protein [Ginsengibacter sp.]
MNKLNKTTPPGAPGVDPRWTSSAKSGVGKSVNPSSNVIFTLSHGIINEVYFPREDLACIRDMEFIVTDSNHFFSEEKRDTDSEIKWIKEGVPAFHIINTCKEKKYSIEKEVITDPLRDVVLQKIKFTQLPGNESTQFKLFAILAPHISNKGFENDGWTEDHKGIKMIMANRDGISLAIASSAGFLKRSVGYVGASDGYTDLKEHKNMEWEYPRADNGNIALTAEIDMSTTSEFVFVISFGIKATDAAHCAVATLLDGFDKAKERYIAGWDQFQNELKNVDDENKSQFKNLRKSAAVLRLHQTNTFPGGVVASISIPWGQIKGDDDIGGYHLVWPRDLVESATGFSALNSKDQVYRILNYLMSIQEEDGRWSQNTWLNGLPKWTGLQMDEIALPISLVDMYHDNYVLEPGKMKRYWLGIKKAISVLIINGPSTQQDRWEEESGLTAFTLATEITGLLGASHLAEINNEPAIAQYCLETADYWNEQIENWTYITGTPLSKKAGVDGYFMRINPTHQPAEEVKNNIIHIKNRTKENGKMYLHELICVDALALVRFGLRAADDPKILNTIKLIDEHLKVETPYGPCWHRYVNDGYGENKEGDPYTDSGDGIGRAWPLLTGERAHYEIAAGNIKRANELLKTMDGFANNGLLPEQIWDTGDIPDQSLFLGKYTGSAMPLTWAHSEYIKLWRSIKDERIFDMSFQTEERYLKKKSPSPFTTWRFDWPCTIISSAKILRIEVLTAATVRWSTNNWATFSDTETKDTGLGIFIADIDLHKMKSKEIKFTFFWKDAEKWENQDFEVGIKKAKKMKK